MRTKQKKITVKPFVNKNLASQDTDYKYPLYFQITFERRNTQVKSHFSTLLSSLGGLKAEDAEKIKFESSILERTVAYEQSKSGSSFTLHGIKERYELYAIALDEVFEIHLKKKLLKAIKYSNSEFLPVLKFEGFEVTFSLLFKASKLLVDNFVKTLPIEFREEIEAYQKYHTLRKLNPWYFRYDCIMDWVDSDYKTELQAQIANYFSEKPIAAEKIIAILHEMVEERLKFS